MIGPLRIVALAVALACAPACGGVPTYPGPATCEVGGGVLSFLPLTDGDSVPIIHGPQGGWHVWGSVRARWLAPDGVHLHYALLEMDRSVIYEVDDVVDLGPPEGVTLPAGWAESLGSRVFVDSVPRIDGRAVVLTLFARDRDDRTCKDERVVVPRS